MDGVQYWINTLADSLQGMWVGVVDFLPSLLGALIVFVVGLIVASGLAALVERILAMVKIDELLRRLGIGEYTQRAGINLNLGKFVGFIVYWFVVIAFFMATTDILGLKAFSEFLRVDVLGFIPRVLVSVLIMLSAAVLGKFLKNLVLASLKGAMLHQASFIGALVWWSVVVFGFFAALFELNIAREIIYTMITGLIAMLALAGGLAFGLGGREFAQNFLRKVEDEMEGR